MHNPNLNETIQTNGAPKAIGPYSQAVRSGGFLFLSGQIPLDPATGVLVTGSAAEQTRRVLENLKAVLEAAGLSLASVVKTSVFLKSMDDYAAMNEVYGQYFTTNPPARSTIEVARLPRGVGLEIDAIARDSA